MMHCYNNIYQKGVGVEETVWFLFIRRRGLVSVWRRGLWGIVVLGVGRLSPRRVGGMSSWGVCGLSSRGVGGSVDTASTQLFSWCRKKTHIKRNNRQYKRSIKEILYYSNINQHTENCKLNIYFATTLHHSRLWLIGLQRFFISNLYLFTLIYTIHFSGPVRTS